MKTKKENNLLTFIKGFIVGLGIILPISSSGLAVVMNIYERLLNVINNFLKNFKKEKNFIIFTIIGVIISCVVSVIAIDYAYDSYRISTLLFFIGLVIGGLPSLLEKTEKDYKTSNLIWTLIGIASLLSLFFFSSESIKTISSSLPGLIIILIVGLVAAGSMIIPGVSGSVVLIIIGYYKPMLEVIHQTLKFQNLSSNIFIVGFFCIGMLIGILIMSRLMEYFLTKFKKKSYFTIVGFVGASVIILIVREMLGYTCSVPELIVGIILFVFGFMLSFKYLKEK